MHPTGCPCRDCTTPLDLDETARLFAFLAERGHLDVARDVAGVLVRNALVDAAEGGGR